MKKPAWRCLENPTNFVGTGRFTDSKYERVECRCCKGSGVHVHDGVTGKCWMCKGVGKISMGVSV